MSYPNSTTPQTQQRQTTITSVGSPQHAGYGKHYVLLQCEADNGVPERAIACEEDFPLDLVAMLPGQRVNTRHTEKGRRLMPLWQQPAAVRMHIEKLRAEAAEAAKQKEAQESNQLFLMNLASALAEAAALAGVDAAICIVSARKAA